jgi:hypothetical protein
MEGHTQSVEDVLVDSLSFKLQPGASYVTERKSVTFHPQGSNVYTATGTKLIKLLITGDSWLDPSTFRVMFDVQNMGTVDQQLRVISGPHSFFRRMRILCGGQVIEDIDDYNRVHELFSTMTAGDSRVNTNAESFGQKWDIDGKFVNALTSANFPGIIAGQSQTVLFKPLSGLLNQNKFIPTRYCPITIELELVNDATVPIIGIVGSFTADNTSLAWQINNVQVKCDMCTLDNGLDNSYAEHLLSGKSFPINYSTYISQNQSILSGVNGQQKVRLNVTRALSRLMSVFVSLDKDIPDTVANAGRKTFNHFYSPMKSYSNSEFNPYNNRGEFQFQLQVGSKLYPEYPIRSHAEGYYQLRKSLGVQSSTLHNFDINSHEYRNSKFILGCDLEKILSAGFTGLSTKSGDILSVRFDHEDTTAANYATSMQIILHSDCIMEIHDAGISVYD